MEHNKFSLEGIFDLCQQYRNDIYERKDLKHVLNRRKVRFINPEGKFDYAYFGDFYFKAMERMMLVTKIVPIPDPINAIKWDIPCGRRCLSYSQGCRPVIEMILVGKYTLEISHL